jgi:hypothetical protein
MDFQAIYYLIMFHKNPRWAEAYKNLAPRELADYVKAYALAMAAERSVTAVREKAIHLQAMDEVRGW